MTLKIAFAGTGGFTRFHAERLVKMDGVHVAAFSGTSLEKAERVAQDWSGAQAFDNVGRMLDEVKPDALYICVPPLGHGAIEEAAIERGIPFLVEKPIGLDIELPARLLERIKAVDLLTSVGYHFRYCGGADIARELLGQRKLGMTLGYWMGGMPLVPWWRDQQQSGGQMIEQTTHMVDLLRYTVGEVTEVYAAYAQRAMHERHEGVTVPDVGTVTMKLADGSVATISNTCILPEGNRIGLHYYTDQGIIELDNVSLRDLRGNDPKRYDNVSDPHAAGSEAFIHALRTGDRSRIRSDYADGFLTQRVTYAALQSAQSGMPVQL